MSLSVAVTATIVTRRMFSHRCGTFCVEVRKIAQKYEQGACKLLYFLK